MNKREPKHRQQRKQKTTKILLTLQPCKKVSHTTPPFPAEPAAFRVSRLPLSMLSHHVCFSIIFPTVQGSIPLLRASLQEWVNLPPQLDGETAPTHHHHHHLHYFCRVSSRNLTRILAHNNSIKHAVFSSTTKKPPQASPIFFRTFRLHR